MFLCFLDHSLFSLLSFDFIQVQRPKLQSSTSWRLTVAERAGSFFPYANSYPKAYPHLETKLKPPGNTLLPAWVHSGVTIVATMPSFPEILTEKEDKFSSLLFGIPIQHITSHSVYNTQAYNSRLNLPPLFPVLLKTSKRTWRHSTRIPNCQRGLNSIMHLHICKSSVFLL